MLIIRLGPEAMTMCKRFLKIHLAAFFGIFLLFSTEMTLHGQSQVSLDNAIRFGAAAIEYGLKAGVKVAVLNFSSPSERFSNYVLEELSEILSKGKLDVVNRNNQDLIIDEIYFQMSGMVSDDSAISIGRQWRADYIISGSLEDMSSYYRIRFRTISVETGAMEVQDSFNVQKDKNTAVLMGEQREGFGPLAYGFMNLALGLGSYLQGDIGGGLISTAGYAAAGALIIWELAGLKYEDALAGIPGTIGLGVAGATMVFGFVKPYLYSKRPQIASVMNGVNIVAVSAEGGISGLGLSYTYSF